MLGNFSNVFAKIKERSDLAHFESKGHDLVIILKWNSNESTLVINTERKAGKLGEF